MALGAVSPLQAADPQADAVMKRMRDTLRNTMTQLQTSEGERATLQTQLAESDQKNKDLASQIDALNKKLDAQTKQMAADKAAADKSISDLNFSMANRDREVARLNEALTKWKDGYSKAVDLARKKEAERADYASRVVVLDRKVADRERQNVELYNTGKEILNRYENFGLGNALLAREPFVGTARVKLQNQVQDYQDKLTEGKVKPTDTSGKAKATSAAPKAGPATSTAQAPASGNKPADQKSKS